MIAERRSRDLAQTERTNIVPKRVPDFPDFAGTGPGEVLQ